MNLYFNLNGLRNATQSTRFPAKDFHAPRQPDGFVRTQKDAGFACPVVGIGDLRSLPKPCAAYVSHLSLRLKEACGKAPLAHRENGPRCRIDS